MSTPTPIEQARAEIKTVIETAAAVAHGGLQPESDGPRVLAGLILQLATQVERSLQVLADPGGSGTSASPNELESPTEEDSTPQDAPAAPRRPV